MLLQKISILLFVFLISLFKPNEPESTQNQISVQSLNYYFNIDSLNVEIKSSGWSIDRLIKYHFYIVNSDVSLKKNILSDLPAGYEYSFLESLLLKKQQNYKEMFNVLLKYFSGQEEYLPYYEELVFAATASDQINLIEERIESGESVNKKFISALLQVSKGEYEKATRLFSEALEKDSTDKNIYYQLSYSYRNIGDYESASKILRKTIEIFSNDNWFVTKALLAQGSLFFLSGDYDNALKFYNDGLKLAIETQDRQNEAKANINIGIIEDISGNIEVAHYHFKKAVSLSSQIKDFENLAIAYSEFGVSYTFTNNLIEAKNNYQKSLTFLEKINNRNRLSLLLNNLGKIYMSMFDYNTALVYYEKGLVYAGDNKRSKALNLTGIADIYANLSNYTKAIQYYRKAQEISSEIKDISLNADINSGLGSLNFNLDRFNNAVQYYLSAKVFAEESGNPYLMTDLNHKIALSYFKLDSLDISEKYFEHALELSKKNSIPYYEALISVDFAALQKEKKDHQLALKNIQRTEDISKVYGFDYLSATAKIIAGEIAEEKGEFNYSERLYREALEISRQLNEFGLQVETNYLLAQLFDKNGFYEAAESYYSSAVKLIEDVSRPLFEDNEVQISYFSAQKEIYDSFAEYYLNQGRFKEAFEFIDKSRSRNMVQNLDNLKLQVLLDDKTKLDRIYEYEWIIHSGIYTGEEINSVKAKYGKLKKELISENPLLERYLNMQNHLTLPDIQNNLNAKENFLSFYTTEEKTYIFLITKDDFKPFIINTGRVDLLGLAENISPYFNPDNLTVGTFYNQDLFSFNVKAANNFYNIILKNVIENIPEGNRVIISQTAELVSLPFDFLVASFDETKSSYNYYDKDYLIYHYSFSYIPSASVFVHQKKNILQNNNRILIAGNPEINTGSNQFAERRGLLEESAGLPRNISMLPLKYSKEEINEINNLINADDVLTENSATETGFKEYAELSKIIHLSTHSFLFNKQPVIFFSNNDDPLNDGFLEVGEIVQLKLNSDLVVLSSCNSGLGYVDASEGIIGMTKAFFEAGSKSVVVSLWEVNDKYTSKLMTLFYKKLSEGFDKDEALRLAKIEFIKNYSPNPYFWSAFILSGNTDKVDIRREFDFYFIIAGLIVSIVITITFISIRRRKLITSH